MGEILYRTFSSLKIRNFRIYYFSQVVSYCGTFLQALAQDWLVLKLTNSGTMLGLVSAFQFLPLLLFIPFGGVIADRFSKRKLLIITQTLLGLFALFLGILILSGAIKIWMVFVLALCLGRGLFERKFGNGWRLSWIGIRTPRPTGVSAGPCRGSWRRRGIVIPTGLT